MRKITKEIIGAFLNHETRTIGNSHTDGCKLLLHGNEIAVHVKGGFDITTAGWNTPTTRERLNGIPGVSVCVKNGQLYLNGQPWNGDYTFIPRY